MKSRFRPIILIIVDLLLISGIAAYALDKKIQTTPVGQLLNNTYGEETLQVELVP